MRVFVYSNDNLRFSLIQRFVSMVLQFLKRVYISKAKRQAHIDNIPQSDLGESL